MAATFPPSSPILTQAPTASRRSKKAWRASFRLKLYSLVAVAALLLLAFNAYTLVRNYQEQIEAKETELSSVLDSAMGVLDGFDKLVKEGKIDRATAETQAYQALRGMRFGPDKDFVFAWRISDKIAVVHGVPGIEGGSITRVSVALRNMPLEAAEKVSQARVDSVRAKGGREFAQVLQARPGASQPVTKMNMNTIYEPWGLVVGSGTYLDRVDAAFRESIIESIVVSIVAIALLLVIGMLIVRSVMRQLGGEPAGAVQVMTAAAQGDFSRTDNGRAHPGSLLAAFGDMSGSIRSTLQNIRGEAGTLKTDATRLADSVQQVTTAATTQSEATSSMAAAIEELTVSVSHISEAAIETEKLSEGVASLCRNSENQVNSASSGMQRIAAAVGEASTKIAGLEARAEQINVIAGAIKEIASQTNLLALNAAIEAARAGEQGRGFSVVADEVRKLAERTASATIEIEQMVQAVQAETKDSTATMSRVRPIVEEGTSLTHEVAESLREIRSRADMTLERIREVANATREQSSASTAIAQRVEGIAQMVEETNASMEETARSASDMRDMSVRLDTLVGQFKV
ncbi:methyl-accepting chemotaxis protein [Pigmentiphaga aceris]|uniref:Methyl-accepting chemotaxis protein n=1 Tax=Pigmentiphaga aceris TaxID=1940612 RepID=A0A5C0ARC3_9BURK|nr:methyl-accepting chemotaxis protein [Pigmentiphaga aceris]QEI04618.1 methyl-accepting chemotaxis protein [Pigmentiphaga aceris]